MNFGYTYHVYILIDEQLVYEINWLSIAATIQMGLNKEILYPAH